MDYCDRNIETYQTNTNTTKLTFARMIESVHATNCTCKKSKKDVFVVKQYAVRKATIRPFSVRNVKRKQEARYVMGVLE